MTFFNGLMSTYIVNLMKLVFIRLLKQLFQAKVLLSNICHTYPVCCPVFCELGIITGGMNVRWNLRTLSAPDHNGHLVPASWKDIILGDFWSLTLCSSSSIVATCFANLISSGLIQKFTCKITCKTNFIKCSITEFSKVIKNGYLIWKN